MSGVKRYRHFPAQYARMFIDTLPSGEYVTGADYDACSSRLHEVAVACANAEQERDELRVQVEALRRVAMELRDYVGCEDVNHRDGEFHDFIQACPVLARIDAALQAKP